jgi:hypothetical protein
MGSMRVYLRSSLSLGTTAQANNCGVRFSTVTSTNELALYNLNPFTNLGVSLPPCARLSSALPSDVVQVALDLLAVK